MVPLSGRPRPLPLTNRGAGAQSAELGRHSDEHRRVANQRRVEQLPKEVHHKVVLIRAPVDLEGMVEDIGAAESPCDETGKEAYNTVFGASIRGEGGLSGRRLL